MPANEYCPKVKLRKRLPRAKMPEYKTEGAAGADVFACLSDTMEKAGSIWLPAGGRHIFDTGLDIEIEPGWQVELRPRSGLAFKHGISIPNTPGTIDADYRGAVRVLLINLGQEPYEVQDEERIAQFVVMPAFRAEFKWSDHLSTTERGTGGYGSTGRT